MAEKHFTLNKILLCGRLECISPEYEPDMYEMVKLANKWTDQQLADGEVFMFTVSQHCTNSLAVDMSGFVAIARNAEQFKTKFNERIDNFIDTDERD